MTIPHPNLTAEQVRHKFDYDKNTGFLTWKNPNHNRIKQGDIAGTVKGNKRITVRVTIDAAIQADQLKALTEVVRLSEEMGLYDNKDAEGKQA